MTDCAVLVLNRNYQPIHITNAKRAFSLLYLGVARAIDAQFRVFDFDSWAQLSAETGDDVLHTIDRVIRVPRVIVLQIYDRLPRTRVRFSRHNIYLRDGNRCQYCGHRFASSELSLDHVIPLSRGGTSTWENVVCACLSCNVKKGNRTPQEAHMRLVTAPKKPRWHPVGQFGTSKFHPAWRNFVDLAYWNAELR